MSHEYNDLFSAGKTAAAVQAGGKPVFSALTMRDVIQLYTDGAAKGNPGPGGYGIVLKYNHHRKEMSGGFRKTTNNRMELLAVIIGLETITNNLVPVEIYSDSRYVVDAINQRWLHNWKRNGFKNKANVDLWLRFLKIYDPSKHTFFWVKGHSDNVENNRCDQLAVLASQQSKLPPDEGFTGAADTLFEKS